MYFDIAKKYIYMFSSNFLELGPVPRQSKIRFCCAVTISVVKVLRRKIGKKTLNMCIKWLKTANKFRKIKLNHEFFNLHLKFSKCYAKSAQFCAVAQQWDGDI